MLARLSRVSVVSIVSIRRRATGVRSQLNARERHAFRKPAESHLIAMGSWGRPGSRWRADGTATPFDWPRTCSGSPAWCGRHTGRSRRALWLRQSCFAGCRARRFFDALARRIAPFDKQAIAETKRLVDVASLPADVEIAPEWEAFLASARRPASQVRIKTVMERGFHKAGDVENRLRYYVGELDR